ncbi:MAG: phosphoglucosamine mutase [Clostridiaceae bacterium]|nr:phosphoglucosamine mutase [Clostridiaceae bacterium]
MGKYFGTDGARGVANQELTPDFALAMGRALVAFLREQTADDSASGAVLRVCGDIQVDVDIVSDGGKGGKSAGTVVGITDPSRLRILIGMDTRLSGGMLSAALAAGICSAGADVWMGGVLPTAALSFLTERGKFSAGAMISASHNPSEYNGIKIVDASGYKLTVEAENRLETYIDAVLEGHGSSPPQGHEVGRMINWDLALGIYKEHLLSAVDFSLQGYNIVLDCANGAAAQVAPEVFSELGANLILTATVPDGLNINLNCGSTNVERLSALTVATDSHIALAFDGDADRLLVCSAAGEVLDGDQIMAILAAHLKEEDDLPGDTIVTTVMSNSGLEDFCSRRGISVVRTDVGDRHVMHEMVASGYGLGGEQSGHIIIREFANTGDGILTALILLKALRSHGMDTRVALSDWLTFPQYNTHVTVPEYADGAVSAAAKRALATAPPVLVLIAEMKTRPGIARILVRPSGTEPIVRIMVEGREEAAVVAAAEELRATIEAVRDKRE